jgi:hypothetical protein
MLCMYHRPGRTLAKLLTAAAVLVTACDTFEFLCTRAGRFGWTDAVANPLWCVVRCVVAVRRALCLLLGRVWSEDSYVCAYICTIDPDIEAEADLW